MCFGFCDSDMNTNTSWQPSQNSGGFLQQQEINGGLSSSVITQSTYGGGFVQNQEIQSGFGGGGGMSSIMTSYQPSFSNNNDLSAQMTTNPSNSQMGQTTWNSNAY